MCSCLMPALPLCATTFLSLLYSAFSMEIVHTPKKKKREREKERKPPPQPTPTPLRQELGRGPRGGQVNKPASLYHTGQMRRAPGGSRPKLPAPIHLPQHDPNPPFFTPFRRP